MKTKTSLVAGRLLQAVVKRGRQHAHHAQSRLRRNLGVQRQRGCQFGQIRQTAAAAAAATTATTTATR